MDAVKDAEFITKNWENKPCLKTNVTIQPPTKGNLINKGCHGKAVWITMQLTNVYYIPQVLIVPNAPWGKIQLRERLYHFLFHLIFIPPYYHC
jgi:hypothetical protein